MKEPAFPGLIIPTPIPPFTQFLPSGKAAETLELPFLHLASILFDVSRQNVVSAARHLQRPVQLRLPAGHAQPAQRAAPEPQQLGHLEIVVFLAQMVGGGLVGVEAIGVSAGVEEAVAAFLQGIGDERVDAESVLDPLQQMSPFFVQLVRRAGRTTANGLDRSPAQVSHEEL